MQQAEHHCSPCVSAWETINRHHVSYHKAGGGFSALWEFLVFPLKSHHVCKTKQWNRQINMRGETECIAIFSLVRWVILLWLPERTTVICNNKQSAMSQILSLEQYASPLFFTLFLRVPYLIYIHIELNHTLHTWGELIPTPFFLLSFQNAHAHRSKSTHAHT